MMIKLRYGNTNTFFIPGNKTGLLVDTDYAGTLPLFYKAIKKCGIQIKDIGYVLATHFHPDHMGLMGELQQQGVCLLLMDVQQPAIHFPDRIFEREKLPFVPVDEKAALVISCLESRDFLAGMGICGEIIPTPSHSQDSISLILDEGDCIAGDLDPVEYTEGYAENEALKKDWERIFSFCPKTIYYAHRPETKLA